MQQLPVIGGISPVKPLNHTRKAAALNTSQADKCLTCAICSEKGGFCDHLTGDQLGALSLNSRRAILRRGECISNEELLIWPIMVITMGVLSMQHLLEDGRKTIAALFMPGDIVDMRGMGNRQRGHLIALGKTGICRLAPVEFEAAVDENLGAQKVAWNSLRDQAYRAMDHAADLAKKQALEKLASFFLECRRRQVDRYNKDRVQIPVRRIDLADYLGMQPETVSRTFKDLQARGVIASEGISNLRILDFPTLRRIANGDKHTQNQKPRHDTDFKPAKIS